MKKLFGFVKAASTYVPTGMIAFVLTLYIAMGQALATNKVCNFPTFLKTFFVVGIITAVVRYCIYLVLKNSIVMSVKFWQDVKQDYITSNYRFFCYCNSSFSTIWETESSINFQKFLIRRLARKFLYQNNLQDFWEVKKNSSELFNTKDPYKTDSRNDIRKVRTEFLNWVIIYLTAKQTN